MERKDTFSSQQLDGIPYMSYNKFAEKYPFDVNEKLGKGMTGSVYPSGEKFAVKEFPNDKTFYNFILELNAYASLSHPCIEKPLAWTYKGYVGYLAMRKGKKITDAYPQKINIQQIMYDTLSAISFMNNLGIMHCDIKPDNMIYYGERCHIIDMGQAQLADLNNDGNYYLDTAAYTPIYRDPEYSFGQYNNINSEIYALFESYIHILEGRQPAFGELYTYSPSSIAEESYKGIEWYFNQAKLFQRYRPSIDHLLESIRTEFDFIPDKGEVYHTPVIGVIDDQDKNLLLWMIEMSYLLDNKVETVFLALHLYRRVYSREIFKRGLLVGCICLHLAGIVLRDVKVTSIESWNQYTKRKIPDFEAEFIKTVLDILALTDGIISTVTYWHFANSSEDLIPLMKDLLNTSYNSGKIRPILQTNHNKCIRMKELFYYSEDLDSLREENTLSPTREVGTVLPCILDIKPNFYTVERRWPRLKSNPSSEVALFDFIGTLLHNRDVLSQVNLKISQDIFTYFKKVYNSEGYSLIEAILNYVCDFDWKDIELKKNEHPFAKSGFVEERKTLVETKKTISPAVTKRNGSSVDKRSTEVRDTPFIRKKSPSLAVDYL